ncbi:hypothetical protein D3C77_786680 [compost metagenome]
MYSNESIPKERRHEYAKRIEVIQNLVIIYERGVMLDYEDLTWTEIGNPLLPEDRRKWAINLKRYLEEDNNI